MPATAVIPFFSQISEKVLSSTAAIVFFKLDAEKLLSRNRATKLFFRFAVERVYTPSANCVITTIVATDTTLFTTEITKMLSTTTTCDCCTRQVNATTLSGYCRDCARPWDVVQDCRRRDARIAVTVSDHGHVVLSRQLSDECDALDMSVHALASLANRIAGVLIDQMEGRHHA